MVKPAIGASASSASVAEDCEIIGKSIKMIQAWVAIAREKLARGGQIPGCLGIIEGALAKAMAQTEIGKVWRPGAA